MRLIVLLVVVAWALAAVAAQRPPLTIRADQVEASGLTEAGEVGGVVATGDVRARSGTLLLRAPRLTFDRRRRVASLEDGVTGVDGALVLGAKRLELNLATSTLTLDDGWMIIKRGVAARDLEALELSENPGAARAVGHNGLTVRARAIARGTGRSFTATGAWLTTCDCPESATPLLAVAADQVDIVPGDVATLRGWTFVLHGFRLPLTLPVPLTLPLSPRRSGLLFPKLALNGPGGVSVEVPYFLTLGDSWDLTLRGRWFNGNASADSHADSSVGVRGVGGEAELRWRPAEEAKGSLVVTGLDDTSLRAEGRQGARGEVVLVHDQALGGGHLALRADVPSDNALLLDTNVALARAELPYLRDEATYARAFGGMGVAFESSTIQALRRFPIPAPPKLERFSLVDTPATVAPLAGLNLGDVTAFGPAMLDSAATLSWEEPTPGLDLAPGRARRFAAQASLGQTMPLASGRAGTLAVETGERAQGFSSPEEAPYGRLGAFAELRGSSRLSRTFANGWRHDIVPSFRVRGFWAGGDAAFARSVFSPRSATTGPTSAAQSPQSVLDVALFPQPMVQAIARLSTSLATETSTPVTLYVEHHLALWPLEAGQLQAGFAGELPKRFWSSRVDLSTAWNAHDRSLADVSARVTLRPGSGFFSAGAHYLSGTGSDASGQPLDLLFTPHDVAVPATASSPLVQGNVSMAWPVTLALHLAAGAVVTRTLPTAPGLASSLSQQYSASLTYDASGCARVAGALVWTPVPGQPTPWPVASFSFELGDFSKAAAAAAASVQAP